MKILVVVDMQNDFIDGALGTKEAVGIVPKVAEKIRGFDRHHRFFRPVGKIERQSLFGRVGAQQGVDDRNPGFAFDNGHIGKIEITDLVNAVGDFE